MAKNNKLVNQYKHMYKHIHFLVPQIYAAIALTLHRQEGWGFKRINRLFAGSQEIWNECAENGVDMLQMCEDETGIQVKENRSN